MLWVLGQQHGGCVLLLTMLTPGLGSTLGDLALDNRPSHPTLDKTNVQTILIVQRNIFYNEITEKLQYHLQKVGKR